MAIFDLSTAISRKQCKIGGKFVLITNRKSYMSLVVILRYFSEFDSFHSALHKSG